MLRLSFILFLILAGASVAANAQIKRPERPPQMSPFSRSLQAVVVTTDGPTAINGRAELFERRSADSGWKYSGTAVPVVIGRSGLAWSADAAPSDAGETKREGDGKSPAGLFPLTFAFGVGVPESAARLPFRKLGEFTECVDDVNSTFYNRVIDRMQVGNFDWKSSERMFQIRPQYDLGVFVGYNSYPVTKGRGSCIFLHIWSDERTPTSGCTAMARPHLEKIVKWLDPKKTPYLVQMTKDDYGKHQSEWNLPKLK